MRVIHDADALPDKITNILESRSGAIDVKVSDSFLQLKSSIIPVFDFKQSFLGCGPSSSYLTI
jgi:hypothetical protein